LTFIISVSVARRWMSWRALRYLRLDYGASNRHNVSLKEWGYI